MQQRLSIITLGVADLARSRRFYEGGLGWRPGFANPEVVFYQLNGFVLALWSRAELAADAGVPDREPGFGGMAIGQNLGSPEEVEVLLAAAAAAGGAITRPGHRAEWGGYTGYFADPDGHPWEVAWNPAWSVDSAGNTHLPSGE